VIRLLSIICSIVLVVFANASYAQPSIDTAKVRCVELGSEAGTEQFEKCVLQLSNMEAVRPVPQQGPPVQTYTQGLPPCAVTVESWHNCIGTQTLPSGQEYVGEFRDGNYHGQGTYTWPDGEKYVGEFRDSKRNGQGTFTFPDGAKHVGEWKDDKANGQGTATWPSGSKYVGEWKNGKRHGQGTYTWPDGAEDFGEWADDKPVQVAPLNLAGLHQEGTSRVLADLMLTTRPIAH
jgi:hypothetical protein